MAGTGTEPEQALAKVAARAVAATWGGSQASITHRFRGPRATVVPRWAAWTLYWQLSPPGKRRSYSAIGRVFDRDRTTIRHGLQRLNELATEDPSLDARYSEAVARARMMMYGSDPDPVPA